MEYIKAPAQPPEQVTEEVRTTVSQIISDVEREGDVAVRRYSERFDSWNPSTFRVPQEAIDRAYEEMNADDEVRTASQFLIDQVRNFAQLQRDTLVDFEAETMPGVFLGQKHIPINNVGAYSPGGRYPLIASAVMTVATGKVAGVPRIMAAAPPKDEFGIHRPQLWAMVESGADEIYCVGGVQGLAGMVFGLEGSEPVDMIVGPGNAYVAEAKRQLFGQVGIDLLAGPTEIMVIADDTGDPGIIACDLLGQAEHGPTSPGILATTSEDVARETIREVERWLESWPTPDVSRQAWENYGTVILVEDHAELAEVADDIAPEHLEVHTSNNDWFVENLTNYGALFVGTQATVAFADKGIGTNHTLPTMRAARYTGGLWVGKFLKTVTTQRCTPEGASIVSEPTSVVADAELMFGHAVSGRLRQNPEYFPDALPPR